MKRTLSHAPIEVANCHRRRMHVACGRCLVVGVTLGLVLAALIIDMVGG